MLKEACPELCQGKNGVPHEFPTDRIGDDCERVCVNCTKRVLVVLEHNTCESGIDVLVDFNK